MSAITRPVRFTIGIAIAALAVWQLAIPGVWTLVNAGDIDRDVDASQRRSVPISGRITTIRSEESYSRRKNRRSVTYWYHAEATLPGATTPVSTNNESLTSRGIKNPGDIPDDRPRTGDLVTLWYDPQDPDRVSPYAPAPGGPSIGWFSLIFLVPAVIALVISAVLIKSSIAKAARTS